ncbi:hypothetical protein GCM10023144_44340 [Pigmentiphaga soli]|uniref:Flagellar hook-length control protein-like C-terminal domain-containing protein n=1 Tax=Pigmentiphaga soli TaxID=1007095 RepID=A0ABP8HPQ7_9BURK
MVTDTRQTRAVSGVTPVQSWERYREDAREAILARLVHGGGTRVDASGQRQPAPQPAGLVRATVLQANTESEALVDIAGHSYLVNTRQALTPGASVILRLLDDRSFFGVDDPRRPAARPSTPAGDPTADEAAGAGEGADAHEAGAARATRGVVPTVMPALAELRMESGSLDVRLSGAARLLFALTAQASGSARMVPLAPLDTADLDDTSRLAQRLQNAVEQSGLFYESHLQEWREGRRSLDALRAEPQAALSPGPGPHPEAASSEPADTTPATPEQNAARGLQAALGAIPDDVRPLVQDQIALLESSRLALQGAWDGRPFTIEVEPDASQARDDIPLSWRIRLRLDTPNLGKLEVDIALRGTEAQVNLKPDSRGARGASLREIRAQLADATPELQQALDARGLRMTGFGVAAQPRQAGARS